MTYVTHVTQKLVRLNIKVPEELVYQLKKLALEINPRRPNISDFLEVAVQIATTETQIYRNHLFKWRTQKGRVV